ncbi:MAG: hypothetical protein BWY68_00193 [bacterium ADurb.Bin400]|nr:MAG: hypothetical protein BWY68_00193 [bacterium ADurb.Bin400]
MSTLAVTQRYTGRVEASIPSVAETLSNVRPDTAARLIAGWIAPNDHLEEVPHRRAYLPHQVMDYLSRHDPESAQAILACLDEPVRQRLSRLGTPI